LKILKNRLILKI